MHRNARQLAQRGAGRKTLSSPHPGHTRGRWRASRGDSQGEGIAEARSPGWSGGRAFSKTSPHVLHWIGRTYGRGSGRPARNTPETTSHRRRRQNSTNAAVNGAPAATDRASRMSPPRIGRRRPGEGAGARVFDTLAWRERLIMVRRCFPDIPGFRSEVNRRGPRARKQWETIGNFGKLSLRKAKH